MINLFQTPLLNSTRFARLFELPFLICVQELQIPATELARRTNPELDCFNLMIQWLQRSGAKFTKLYLQYCQMRPRVHALSMIEKDEVLLYVPLNQIMTSSVAINSMIGRKIAESGIELRSKHSYLASYLLYEKYSGESSYWAAYIKILPQQYSNM